MTIKVSAPEGENRVLDTFFISESIAVCIEVYEIEPLDSIQYRVVMAADSGTVVNEEVVAASDAFVRGKIDTKNWFSVKFNRPGQVLISAIARSENMVNVDSQVIWVVEKEGENKAPRIELEPYRKYASVSLPCSLKVSIDNDEVWQGLQVEIFDGSKVLNDSVVRGDSLAVWEIGADDSTGVHDIRVTVTDNGNPPGSATDTVSITVITDSTRFGTPQNVRLVERTEKATVLEWDADSLCDGYVVYRSSTAAFDDVDTFRIQTSVFVDSTDTIFFYKVTGSNFFGESPTSDVVAGGDISSGNDTLPNVPKGLTVVAKDTSMIRIQWKDNAVAVNGYKIVRGTSEDSEFGQIATTGEHDTAFTDTGLLDGMRYYYSVISLEDTGESPPSEAVSAVTNVVLNITVYRGIGGTVTTEPDKKMFTVGDSVAITATPDSGYVFNGWAGDIQGKNPVVKVGMDSSMHLDASFINRAPVLYLVGDTTVLADALFEFTVGAEDLDGDSVTLYSGTLPEGASFTTETGQFRWTPRRDQEGAYTIKFIALDAQNKTTDSVFISVLTIPAIDSASTSRTVCTGDRVTLDVTASGSAPLTFQWSRSGTEISEAVTCSLAVASADTGDAGIYECRVANSAGSVSMIPCTLTVNSPVTIEAQSPGMSVCNANRAVLFVTASGTSPLGYEWMKNGERIENITGDSLVFNAMAQGDAGTYVCRIVNPCGEVSSDTMMVKCVEPSVAADGISLSSASVCSGYPVTLSVRGGQLGTGASWKWYADSCGKNDPIGSDTSITLVPAGTMTYLVRAEGDCNSTDCVSASVTVKTASSTPDSIVADRNPICSGDSTVLRISGGVLGTNASWEWYEGSGCGVGEYKGVGDSLVVKPTATTWYSVKGKGDCASSEWVCIELAVGTFCENPQAAVADREILCQGDSTMVRVSGGNLGTDGHWRWYANDCGSTDPLGEGDSLLVKPQITTIYFVRAEGLCNTSSCASVTVRVDSLSLAAESVTADPPSICPGAQSTLTVNGGLLGTAAQWKWYAGSCDGVPFDSGVSLVVSPGGTTSYFVRAEGTCNVTACAEVTIIQNTVSVEADSISPQAVTVCRGESVDLTVSGGTLGTGGKWVWYAGACEGTPVGEGETFTARPDASTTYMVRAEDNCGSTQCRSAAVTVNTLSVVPTGISPSPVRVCPDGSATITQTGGSLGTNAQWRWYRNDALTELEGEGESIEIRPPFASSYYVRAEGTCNSTDPVHVDAIVNTVSSAADGILMEPDVSSICRDTRIMLRVQNGRLGDGAHWAWYTGSCGDGNHLMGTGDTLSDTPAATTSYFVRAEGGCGVPTDCAQRSVTVFQHPTTPAINNGSNGSICTGGTLPLTVTSGFVGSNGGVWVWYNGRDGSGGRITSGVNSITVGPGATAYYSVRSENDGCGLSGFGNTMVIVNIPPIQPTSIRLSHDNVCPNSYATFSIPDGSFPGTDGHWEWYDGSGCSGSVLSQTTSLRVMPGVTRDYSVKATGGPCGECPCTARRVTVSSAYSCYSDPYFTSSLKSTSEKILSKSFQIGEF